MTPAPSLRQHLAGVFGSLKLRITVGMIAVLVFGIGLTTLILVKDTEHDVLRVARSSERAEVARTASGVSQRLLELQNALKIQVENLDRETVGNQAATDEFMSGLGLLKTMFSSLYMIDSKGRMRALVDDDGLAHPMLDLSDRAYFRQSLLENRPVISEVLSSRLNGEPIIVLAQPLFDAKGAYGVFVGSLNLQRRDMLVDLVAPVSVRDESLRVVTDGQGRILAHPDRKLVLSQLSAEPRLAEAAKWFHENGKLIEPIGLTVSSGTGIVSVGRIFGSDWVVWRSLSEAQLFAPLHAARRNALGWACVLIVISSILTVFGTSILLRPLKRVQQRATQMFDDKLDPLAGWPAVGGEIGDLAKALRDIGAEQSRLEHSNDQLLQQLSSVMANAPVGIVFTRDKRFELVSAECCRLLGRSEAELLGQPTRIIYESQSDYEALGAAVAAAFAAGEAYVGDVRMLRADGSRFWAHLRGRPVDAANDHAGTIWTITDITEQVIARNELEWAASHDSLTGLANRQAFELRLERMFATQPQSLPACLLMIDLDYFKQVNDGAGHAAGDAVLCAVARVLLARVRGRDLVARLGGDEFAVLLDHCSVDAAQKLASELSQAISAISLPYRHPTLRFGASIGVAELNSTFTDTDRWVDAADKACYEAKAAGRGQVMVAPVQRPSLRVIHP